MKPVRKQRRWNLLATLSLLLAVILALIAITRIDIKPVQTRDALRLSTSARSLTIDPDHLPASGWTTLRGDLLNAGEAKVDQEALATAPYRAQVGVYANTASELDLSVPSFASSGYIWLIWDEPLQRYLDAAGIAIDQRFTLLNTLITDAPPELNPVGEGPERRADGGYYQLFTYRGRYLLDQASFRHYPFMSISLPLFIEADDVDGSLSYNQLRLEPDIRDSGMGFNARILGWLNQGWSIAEYRHQYATSFGQGGGESDYSLVLYEMSFGTSAWAAVWRLLLPLVVLMAMVLLVFKVRPDEQDARASIPVTVLLTLVFLQQTYRSDLPVLPFLTFLDQVYVVAYVVTLVAFVLVIWIGRRYADMEAMEDPAAQAALRGRLEHLDNSWPVVVVLFSSLAIAVAWFTIPPGA
ncbi:hypothetical protein H6G16_09615 [Cyanobium sp. FACHB-13342]|nr:hypothetical protein [Cyanobium sp. FACHB-13342]MBD2423731.1 hypothetical protein [Cyanobium sp. FACHB-13342]